MRHVMIPASRVCAAYDEGVHIHRIGNSFNALGSGNVYQTRQ